MQNTDRIGVVSAALLCFRPVQCAMTRRLEAVVSLEKRDGHSDVRRAAKSVPRPPYQG